MKTLILNLTECVSEVTLLDGFLLLNTAMPTTHGANSLKLQDYPLKSVID